MRSTVKFVTLHLCFHPPIHPSSYSPFWAFVSLKRCLHSSLTPARLLHPSTHRTRNAPSRRRPLVLPFVLLLISCCATLLCTVNEIQLHGHHGNENSSSYNLTSRRRTWVLVRAYYLKANAVRSCCTGRSTETELSPTVGTVQGTFGK